jgi:hypothetical protein
MKKLRLSCEELRVESFPTARVESAPGTVHAHGGTVAGVSCPAQLCHTYDDTVCGLTRACG